MHKIMGGEFAISSELLSTNNKAIELQYSSGRSALFSILMHLKETNRRILLPGYLCDSITRTVIDAGWSHDFYPVNEELHPCIDPSVLQQEYAAVLVIDYFGMVDLKNDIAAIRNRNPEIVIIEDDVQAYYDLRNTSADHSFTSLRKWFPCPDGAMVFSETANPVVPRIERKNEWAQYKLAGNLLKERADFLEDSISLSLLNQGEELLEEGYLSPCSDAGKQIFANLNQEQIAAARKQNAQLLHAELDQLGIRHLYSAGSVPLFLPIFVANRDELRRHFFSEQIFTPKHWPMIDRTLNGSSPLYEQELSLICDQRYGAEDIKRQIEVLKQFLCR